MSKKILLLHGFEGNPKLYFFPWLIKALEPFGEVICPSLPNPASPKLSEWIKCVKDLVGEEEVDLTIGHSLGGTLALSMLSQELLITDGLMTFGSSHCPKDDECMNDFLVPPIQVQNIKNKIPFYAFSSYDDPYTHHECSALLVKQIGAVGIFFEKEGHFLEEQLPTQAWDIVASFLKKHKE